jgi:hypothetical protein
VADLTYSGNFAATAKLEFGSPNVLPINRNMKLGLSSLMLMFLFYIFSSVGECFFHRYRIE